MLNTMLPLNCSSSVKNRSFNIGCNYGWLCIRLLTLSVFCIIILIGASSPTKAAESKLWDVGRVKQFSGDVENGHKVNYGKFHFDLQKLIHVTMNLVSPVARFRKFVGDGFFNLFGLSKAKSWLWNSLVISEFSRMSFCFVVLIDDSAFDFVEWNESWLFTNKLRTIILQFFFSRMFEFA